MRRWPPPEAMRFVADAHLGALARRLRMAGFDTCFRNDFADREIAALAADEGRIVLTRDRALLQHKAISHACYIHATAPLHISTTHKDKLLKTLDKLQDSM